VGCSRLEHDWTAEADQREVTGSDERSRRLICDPKRARARELVAADSCLLAVESPRRTVVELVRAHASKTGPVKDRFRYYERRRRRGTGGGGADR